uniref:THAP domain-containing protein 6-like n=1 Tax=Epinephelus lanceolatus TaxID=310571 RepID=UPI0014450ACF|nr:THAP domain-containing protein 6-like [Epinephelus lanceolatus]
MWQAEKMPHSCAAWKCTNRFTVQTKSQGITFHRFPKDTARRKQWEVALRREGFSASSSSMLCSEHFKPEDFDRTGQTVRIRDGAVPSVFSFSAHPQRPVATRTAEPSKKVLKEETLAVDCSQLVQDTDEPLPVPSVDHSYVLPSSPDDLRARLSDALARVESLEREKRNAKDRERRAKNTVCSLLENLRGKKHINQELKNKLDSYSGKMKIQICRKSKRS